MRLVALISTALILVSVQALTYAAPLSPTSPQGAFMVSRLTDYSDHYWARVAGRDTGLRPRVNGHDEFAARWTKAVESSLHGLHVGLFRQSFPTPGFRKKPARRPGSNIIISVPGSQTPDRAVVIGTHYDGEPTSRGSTYDDTSGCVIMLALARTLGAFWRAHGPPALTVEFVLFDSEEQGLVGSTYYGSLLGKGAILPQPVVMLDEEQSGVGYPVRPFGLAADNPLPMFASTSERLPPSMGTPTPIGSSEARLLTNRLEAAVGTVFTQLHDAYSPLPYRGGDLSVFTDADRQLIQTGPISECCSDNDPFQVHGIANVTFSGDYSFYDRDAKPWSYPFDQPSDTMASLACDTGGSAKPGRALEAALDLPYALSRELVLDYAPATPGSGATAFSTAAVARKPVHFLAVGGGAIHWSFGDGASSSRRAPTHTYRRAGTYSVVLRVGTGTARWTLTVRSRPASFHSYFGLLNPPSVRVWHPQQLAHRAGCP